MTEYIERGAVMEEIQKHIQTIGVNAERLVARFPAADVEPVVRCKDCWYYEKRDDYAKEYEVDECGSCKAENGLNDHVYPNDFCSCARRRAHMDLKEERK